MIREHVLFFFALLFSMQASGSVFETWTRFSFQYTNLGRAEASDTATGLATITTSSSTSVHLSTLTTGFNTDLSLSTAIPVTDPTAAPITSVILTSIRARPDLQGGVFGNLSGAVASTVASIVPSTVGLGEVAVICCVIAVCRLCYLINKLKEDEDEGDSLTAAPGVYVGHGVGGIITMGGTGSIRISVVGGPYAVKTVSAVNRTANGAFDLFVEHGFAHGPASLTSSTAQASGVLQIVTATHIHAEGLFNEPGDVSGYISRTLIHFVPEPRVLSLLVAGAIGMVVLGRAR